MPTTDQFSDDEVPLRVMKEHYYWATNSRALTYWKCGRRTLCGKSWKLLLSKYPLFLLFCFHSEKLEENITVNQIKGSCWVFHFFQICTSTAKSHHFLS